MPRPIAPVPPFSPDHETIAPIILDMDAQNLFANAAAPERWTLHALRLRQAQQITRKQLCLLERHVITALAITTIPKQWAILATADTLGQIDIRALTEPCLAGLLQHAENLYLNILAGAVRTPGQLATRVESRKTQLAGLCPGPATAYVVFIDRVADRLRPLLR